MKLDRNTYEAWLLDRIEGKLDPAQERELEAFLTANPDLSIEEDALPTVLTGTDVMERKDELKKGFPPTGDPDVHRLNDFLIARLEGTLTPQQERALDKFLFEHQELDQSAKRMAAARVRPEEVRFTDRVSIERHFPPQGAPDKHRITDFLIAAHEGDLNGTQKGALRSFLQHDASAQREERLIKAARVLPEEVVFAGKEELKKREGRVIALRTSTSRPWFRYAAAASIALLLGLAWWMTRERGDVQQVARIEKKQGVQQAPEVKPAPAPAPELRAPSNVVPPQRQGTSSTAERKPEVGQVTDALPVPPSTVKPNDPLPEPTREPQFAQNPVPADGPERAVPHDVPVPGSVSNDNSAQRSQPGSESVKGVSLAAFAANAVRKEIGEAPRTEGLDKDDALAAVNKGLDAITGGKGELEVQQSASRKRFKLRLGNGFAITASSGR